MRVVDATSHELLADASVVAGHAGLQRRVSWVHVVELPEPGPWISRDQLLLTTGFAWPGSDGLMRDLIRELDSRGIAGIGLAVPSYHQQFPVAAQREADRVGMPLLEIPWEIPFATISETLNRAIISEQQRHREQADAIHRSLTRSSIEANSLEEIVSEFSRLVQRTVVLEDIDGNIIASQVRSDITAPDAPGFRGSNDESGQSISQLVGRGYSTSIRNSQSALRVPWNNLMGSGSVIVCPVWLKRELAAILWIPDESEPHEIDMQAAEHAATVIALYIARERAVVDVEQRLRYTLIDSLLEGQFTGDALGMERATLMGFDPAAEYRVAIFVLGEPTPLSRAGYLRRERFVHRLTRRMTQLGHAPLISPSLNEISVLVPSETPLEALSDRLLEDDVSASVGRSYGGIDGIRKSYREARSVVEWSLPNSITTYDDVLLPRLLQGDDDARDCFMEDMLRPLYNALHSDLYIDTLHHLVACGFNQNQASRELGIHPKTMQYRIGRIQDLLQLDLSQTDVRFRIQLLYRLMDIEQRRSQSRPKESVTQ